MIKTAVTTVPNPEAAEASPLAREMDSSHRRLVESYRDDYGLAPGEALAKADALLSNEYFERTLCDDPANISWCDLHNLDKQDPALREECWQRMQKAAEEELQSGHRAAIAVEVSNVRPWERVQFLVLRESLARDWQPRNGIEWSLIDTLAQAQTMQSFWLQRLTLWSCLEPRANSETVKEEGRWHPPRVDVADAVEEAAKMVERFNRMAIRTLRALRDLRRYAPNVIVQNAGQVNVGEQQVNVAG